ncbi:hypothetical protein ACOSQ3_025755 [Xanthoceras sorbifolium]
MAACAQVVKMVLVVDCAETMAILRGFQLALETGISVSLLESDVASVVSILNSAKLELSSGWKMFLHPSKF